MDETQEQLELLDKLSFLKDYGFEVQVRRTGVNDYGGYHSYQCNVQEGRLDGIVFDFDCQVKEDRYEFNYWEDRWENIDYDLIWRYMCFRTMNSYHDLKYEYKKQDSRFEGRIKVAERNATEAELERLKAAKYRKVGPDKWEWINQEIRVYYEARKAQLSAGNEDG